MPKVLNKKTDDIPDEGVYVLRSVQRWRALRGEDGDNDG